MVPRLPLVMVVACLAGGCAGAPVRRVGQLRADDPSWPREPGHQIAFVGEISVPEHLGIERGFFARLWAALTGDAEQTALYRPFGVAVAGDGRIAVSDPGRRAVRLYAPAANQHLRLDDGLRYPIAVAFVGELLVVADAETAKVTAFDRGGASVPVPWKLPVFGRPTGLAVDPARARLLVVDVLGHCVHVVSLNGGPPSSFGTRGGALGELNFPTAVAVDGDGRVFVNDTMNFRVQVFSPALVPLRAFGSAGDTPGAFSKAKGLAVDRDGTVYIVEGLFDVVQAFGADGPLLGVFGGSGTGPGRFWLPAGVAIDAQRRLYVADTWNGRVQVFDLDQRVR